MPTHGSITKAGKVRSQTPKLDGRPRRSDIPRRRGRLNARKRLVLGMKPGQNWAS
ncbi:MAG: 30S ribosomal protein S30e [Candidatus Bathyarchaeia archaeon]|jgi:small subunit ribosomal protein S30e|nr:30S ribosomal protein S30e [Candidatus Bathyarchaeota archaeon]